MGGSICQNCAGGGGGGLGLTIGWGELGRVGSILYFKKYLIRMFPNNRPTSCVARNENWEVRVLAGSKYA